MAWNQKDWDEYSEDIDERMRKRWSGNVDLGATSEEPVEQPKIEEKPQCITEERAVWTQLSLFD